MTRWVAGVVLTLLFGGIADAQTNEEKYKTKLQKEFLSKIEWVDSLEKAKEMSKKTGKPIFGYFTRSYAP
ncbi:MAG: hypothetical protein AAF488_10010 [Planctomycetota bacterium]